jgi:pilus assembly protein CpaE
MTRHMNFMQRAKVLIASSDQDSADFMQNALSVLSQFDAELVNRDSLLAESGTFDQDNYDLLIIDAGKGEFIDSGQAQELRDRFARLPLIVVSEPLQDKHMRQLLRLNSKDWLKKPLDRKMFLESITGNIQLTQAGDNKVHAVVSSVGGAGATSVAITMANAMAKVKKKIQPIVTLFDLDFSAGSCGQYLNIANDYDLGPVLTNPKRVDLEFIDIIKKRHESGFSVLSFKHPQVITSPNGKELVLRMLDVVSFENDHTVIDIPYYETNWKDEILTAVNSITLVTDCTIPGLRQAKDVYSRIKRIKRDDTPITIIANKHRSRLFGFGIGKKETRKIFNKANSLLIDDDWDTLTEAVNRGVLPADVSSRSKFVRQVEKMAETVA